jgi:hypothetical protein
MVGTIKFPLEVITPGKVGIGMPKIHTTACHRKT